MNSPRLTPLKKATYCTDPATGKKIPVSKYPLADEIWINNVYTVYVTDHIEEDGVWMKHLSIKRNDREPIGYWADIQWIKNRLVGRECEAVQLFPAESRVLNAANQYHIWAVTDPEYRFPFGWGEEVKYEGTPEDAAEIGAKLTPRES